MAENLCQAVNISDLLLKNLIGNELQDINHCLFFKKFVYSVVCHEVSPTSF